jgi:hypothetical protein
MAPWWRIARKAERRLIEAGRRAALESTDY